MTRTIHRCWWCGAPVEKGVKFCSEEHEALWKKEDAESEPEEEEE